MYVYSISTKIVPAIENKWVQWQQEIYIPQVMATGCFTHYTFYKLLEPVDDENDCIYITQFFAVTKEDYNAYINEYVERISIKAFEKWGNQFIAFRTFMKSVV